MIRQLLQLSDKAILNLHLMIKVTIRTEWVNSFNPGDDWSRLWQIKYVYTLIIAPKGLSAQGIPYLPKRDPRRNIFLCASTKCMQCA